MSAIPMTMSAVVPSWRSSSSTHVRTERSDGSTASAVTIHGPSGPCVSKLLPGHIVGVSCCQSRTETSLPTV
jgi:hypothetical protein